MCVINHKLYNTNTNLPYGKYKNSVTFCQRFKHWRIQSKTVSEIYAKSTFNVYVKTWCSYFASSQTSLKVIIQKVYVQFLFCISIHIKYLQSSYSPLDVIRLCSSGTKMIKLALAMKRRFIWLIVY